ncbi:hypothetical protein SAMN02745220_05014 [Desulfopila aestuarii DSM 18488]|uniref:Uncharacterized protein n=1 Tax=Desulfopila aestuarii DSM 18488 TaxID=1121416 RepID=A0A1M7YKW1_9BACT|nr:hypothetical protein SAMN02745220_05014 [Desulfopila aestuarii DSM 18488]
MAQMLYATVAGARFKEKRDKLYIRNSVRLVEGVFLIAFARSSQFKVGSGYKNHGESYDASRTETAHAKENFKGNCADNIAGRIHRGDDGAGS